MRVPAAATAAAVGFRLRMLVTPAVLAALATLQGGRAASDARSRACRPRPTAPLHVPWCGTVLARAVSASARARASGAQEAPADRGTATKQTKKL